ncbi:hypothetical protein J2X72_001158 [Phyllobacterium sp. 1468]|uniref:hypothetical protein n=1 Tax=Phyllobacterium sp. 1468 TaxID=2817759 RepID=UPI00285AECCA|nr:hypothetical protein [Phyllobacterium sp. 1468]MDR6632374.1 hypothetical protein [Phyllobacterium sp. 1468]
MTSNLKEKQTHTDGLPLEANDISESDGDHDADEFEQIGVLAERILSRAKAKKETGEADAAASPFSFAQASLGGQEDVESKSVRRAVRAGNRRNGRTLFGHENENFMAEQKTK